MEYWKIERNKPISIVIKGYLDKKGGKVTDSRKEIQKRFNGVDWEDQKRIVFAFLQSGATDRDWVYSYIQSGMTALSRNCKSCGRNIMRNHYHGLLLGFFQLTT